MPQRHLSLNQWHYYWLFGQSGPDFVFDITCLGNRIANSTAPAYIYYKCNAHHSNHLHHTYCIQMPSIGMIQYTCTSTNVTKCCFMCQRNENVIFLFYVFLFIPSLIQWKLFEYKSKRMDHKKAYLRVKLHLYKIFIVK